MVSDLLKYDYASFTVANGSTDYDVATNQSNLFSNIPRAGYVRITTDNDISFKLNETTNPAISMTGSESPIVFSKDGIRLLPIHNLYITNSSGHDATVGILLSSEHDADMAVSGSF